jgi:hypothetical protein
VNFRFLQYLPGKMALLAFEFQSRMASLINLAVPTQAGFLTNARTGDRVFEGSKVVRIKIEAVYATGRVGAMESKTRGDEGGLYAWGISQAEQIF